MARAPVMSSDKGDGADGTPQEVMDAANSLVDDIIREAEATVSKSHTSSDERRKFQILSTLKDRAVKWFREHFGTRRRDRVHSRDAQERIQVAKSS